MEPATVEPSIHRDHICGRMPLLRVLASADLRAATDSLPITGVRSTSTDHFPGYLSAVIFCAPVLAVTRGHYSWNAVEHFLDRWADRLGAVAFCGVDTLTQPALLRALERCQALGYATAVHVRRPRLFGIDPLLPLLDWLSLNVTLEGADSIYGSLHKVIASSVDFECTTSIASDTVDAAELLRLAERLADLGVSNFALYADEQTAASPRLQALRAQLEGMFRRFWLRLRYAREL